jgi:hypothetical protein
MAKGTCPFGSGVKGWGSSLWPCRGEGAPHGRASTTAGCVALGRVLPLRVSLFPSAKWRVQETWCHPVTKRPASDPRGLCCLSLCLG